MSRERPSPGHRRRLEPSSRPVIRAFDSACVLALSVSAVACSPRVHWDEKSALDFNPAGHTVSVFGVYKDGQMSADAWDALRPRLEPLLGGRKCEIVGGDPRADGSLISAIDDYARTNGPTENLLAQLAPAAEGDLILVLVEAGRLPASDEKVSVVNSTAPAGPSPAGSKGTAGFAAFAPSKRSDGVDRNVLQLTASLFSVAQGRSVAVVDMQYSGDSVSEAESEFTARVGRLLPAAKCKGWGSRANVDPDRIRRLADD
jgi:hypothetical protein